MYVRYQMAVKELYRNLELFVQMNKNSGKKIVVFGTSKIAGMITLYLSKNGMQVDCIVDNSKDKQGKMAFGIEIFSPDSLMEKYNSNVLVIIASMFQEQMTSQLEEMGYSMGDNIVKIIDLPMLMKDYSYVDRTIMVKVSDEEVKAEMVRVLKRLKEICEQNDLKYWLYAGTLLGAVRHKGFIPWDDDIDVYMEIKDMKKLANILKDDAEFSMVNFFDSEDDYYDSEVSVMYSEKYIMDTNHFPMKYSTGVGIDIYPLFGGPQDISSAEKFLAGYKELEMKMWGSLYDTNECQKVADEILEYICKYDFYESKYVMSTSNGYFATIVPQELYLNRKLYEFEGEKFYGPCEYDYVLTAAYGDYMTLPPVEKRIVRHNYRVYEKR